MLLLVEITKEYDIKLKSGNTTAHLFDNLQNITARNFLKVLCNN